MNFTKVQGAGNDFVLVETSDMQRDWSQIALAICNRHFGVGADGLLLVLPSDVADFRMRVFNPDGFEAEACGNGLRCVVKYVVVKRLTDTEAQELQIETKSGIRKVKLYKTGNKLAKIQVSMGEPKLGAKDIPVIIEQVEGDILDIKPILDCPVTIMGRKLLLALVSMGNPHAVYFLSYPVSDFPLAEIGPEVGRLSVFPEGVNFEVAYIVPTSQQIEARVWERGAGETLACGSGACAVAVAARLHGYIGSDKVDIKLPGGILEVEWDGVGEVFLSGPAEIVFTGEWSSESIKTS